jgi:hypothetical protein
MSNMTNFQKIILIIDIALFLLSFLVKQPVLSASMNAVGVILLIVAFFRPKKK